eukprot:EG_transcript_14402
MALLCPTVIAEDRADASISNAQQVAAPQPQVKAQALLYVGRLPPEARLVPTPATRGRPGDVPNAAPTPPALQPPQSPGSGAGGQLPPPPLGDAQVSRLAPHGSLAGRPGLAPPPPGPRTGLDPPGLPDSLQQPIAPRSPNRDLDVSTGDLLSLPTHPDQNPAVIPEDDVPDRRSDERRSADPPWATVLDAAERWLPDGWRLADFPWKELVTAVARLRPAGPPDAQNPAAASSGAPVATAANHRRLLQIRRPLARLPFPLHRPSDPPLSAEEGPLAPASRGRLPPPTDAIPPPQTEPSDDPHPSSNDPAKPPPAAPPAGPLRALPPATAEEPEEPDDEADDASDDAFSSDGWSPDDSALLSLLEDGDPDGLLQPKATGPSDVEEYLFPPSLAPFSPEPLPGDPA